MLKDTEFAYAVARVRSNENKLLSSQTVENLINAPDYKDAVKILSESGFGDLEKNDENEILSKRQRQAFELIYESAPDKECLDFLIVKNDFHNIKAILKSTVTGQDSEKLLVFPTVVETERLKSALDNKDYTLVPEVFGVILKEAYELITRTMDGQLLEVYLDRKSLEMSLSLAKKTKDSFSISLAGLMTTLCDIKIALRCCKTGKDKEFVKNALAECDGIDTEELTNACLDGIDALCGYVSKLGFGRLSESMKKSYASFEKCFDDMLVEKIKDAKYTSFGIAPLVAYYFATDAEIKTVRIILSCKKNGLDTESIRERVRELYV